MSLAFHFIVCFVAMCGTNKFTFVDRIAINIIVTSNVSCHIYRVPESASLAQDIFRTSLKRQVIFEFSVAKCFKYDSMQMTHQSVEERNCI